MSHIVAEPNTELAVLLLIAGHDEKVLRRHAGFPSLRAARDFANRSDTMAEVERAVETRRLRIGIKSLAVIEQLLDSDATDGRTRVAAARTGLEAGGILRKDWRSLERKLTRELSVPELNQLIAQTRAELERAEAAARRQPVALITGK